MRIKVEWRYVLKAHGEQSAAEIGMAAMQLWFASSWVTLPLVSAYSIHWQSLNTN